MAFRIIALALMAVFYGGYFLKRLCQGRQGIKTMQIGREKTGLAKTVEYIMTGSAVLVAALQLVSIALGLTAFPSHARGIGAVVSGLGTAVFFAAMIAMGDSWRVGAAKTEKTKLVTRGIFGISRNPAFLGFDLLHIGLLLMFFNWVLFAATALAVTALHLQIVNVEEDALLETFGDDYRRYQKKVNRYLGRRRAGKKGVSI